MRFIVYKNEFSQPTGAFSIVKPTDPAELRPLNECVRLGLFVCLTSAALAIFEGA